MSSKRTTHLLKQLRDLMLNPKYVIEPIQAYIVPSNDAHNSEYLADCDKYRAFISGFTGSAGTAIVTEQQACLWTDGRYFLQATEELDSNWTLMRDGIPTTPTQEAWLCKALPKGSKVGVDPKLFTNNMWCNMQSQLENCGHKLVPIVENLIKIIWANDRPKRPTNPINPLPLRYTGKSVGDKLAAIRSKMADKDVSCLVLTALDEIAWTLNLRGSDIQYNPVFFSFVVISLTDLLIFLNPEQTTDVIKQHLKTELNSNFQIFPYKDIANYLSHLTSSDSVWFSEHASYALTSLIPKKSLQLTNTTPVALMKAVKNQQEIEGMRNAHIKDGVALCRYFSWLEKALATNVYVTEISGAAKLLEFRKTQPDFQGASFATISSVGAHGAIIHYQPEPKTDIAITNKELYLCDSGGQYKDGTTDVTRTLHFGQPTLFERQCYTRVLKGQIKLATSVFPSKIKGNCLDSFAREFLWEVGLDYAHGTGHGIGSYLNVHEGPMGISWRVIAEDPGLEAGMFVSNEPGYYEDGKFGIRIEDIVQIIGADTEFNFKSRGFLTFDTITLVPKQTKMIAMDMLNDKEIDYLNGYHMKCRQVLGPLLEQQDLQAKEWLWKETEPIGRNK